MLCMFLGGGAGHKDVVDKIIGEIEIVEDCIHVSLE